MAKNKVAIPLHKTAQEETIGIPYQIAGYSDIGLFDSGSTEAGIPAHVAKLINYETFPPAPPHPGEYIPPGVVARRYLPLDIPGLPTKMIPFASAAGAKGS